MPDEKEKNQECCSGGGKAACCTVAALVTIDGRGQIVLPKELREKAGIKAGDKLAIVSLGSENDVCCISILKSSDLADVIKNKLGPLMKNLFE